MTDIRNSLALQYIIDESYESDINDLKDKIALLIFIYDKKKLQNLAAYKKSIPNGVKIFSLF